MPSKRICKCGKLIDIELRMCADCERSNKKRKQAYEKQRGSSTERGYDAPWRRYRTAFLREHPLCEICLKEDRVTASTVVDHIIPHKGDKKLFWNPKNHQAVCIPCHNRKTASEDMGSWRAGGRR